MIRRLPQGLRAAVVSAAVAFVLVFSAHPAQATEIERVVSPGGIEAWLVQDHLNPIISMRIAWRGGSALDPKGKEGLANMVSTLLDEGADDLDSKTFQQTLEDNSITLRFDSARDSFGARLQTLTEYRELAFDMLRKAVTKPRFDAEPVERLRSQLLAGLRRDQEQADAIAGKALMAALYPDHPYGRPSDGTLDTVAKISADDLKQFAARRLARDTVAIGIVGDITPEQLAPLLDKTFGALPAKADEFINVLTGGTSKMEGVVELAEEIFHMPVRVGYPQAVQGMADIVRNPVYATACGLLHYAAQHPGEASRGLLVSGEAGPGWWARLRQWFGSNF